MTLRRVQGAGYLTRHQRVSQVARWVTRLVAFWSQKHRRLTVAAWLARQAGPLRNKRRTASVEESQARRCHKTQTKHKRNTNKTQTKHNKPTGLGLEDRASKARGWLQETVMWRRLWRGTARRAAIISWRRISSTISRAASLVYTGVRTGERWVEAGDPAAGLAGQSDHSSGSFDVEDVLVRDSCTEQATNTWADTTTSGWQDRLGGAGRGWKGSRRGVAGANDD